MRYNPDVHHRQSIRLKEYDYSKEGMYFITICTKDREYILSEIVGADDPVCPRLTEIGEMVNECWYKMNQIYESVIIHEYIIMPNHVHMIICLSAVGHGNPTLQFVVGQIKSYTTKRWNEICGTNNLSFWQHSFHEHIIRNEIEYQHIWQYIDQNLDKWSEDKYYI